MSDVPEGYRMSEVGVIPEEWEVKQFGDFAYLSKNYINPQHSKKSYPCIELEHLTQETGLLLGFVESKEQLSQKLIFSRGDVLFGKLRPYLKKFYFAEFDGVCTSEIWVIKPYNNVIGQFVFHLIQSNRFLETANQTSGTKMPRADWKIVSCTPFPLPPLSEQKAIASALSDVDALITALEQLIIKKRNIKQGAMQELLTGKKRLPGFGGEWEVLNIDEIADVKGGKRLPEGKSLSDSETQHPYIRVADMYQGGVSLEKIKYVPDNVFPTIKNYLISKDDLFITVAGTLGIVGKIPPILNGANLTENADKLTNIKCDQDFLLYILMSSKFQNYVEAARTLGAQPKLALVRIQNFQTLLPPLPEQKAIAQILFDMDTEIESLEQKRDKYKDIKQGMMQELLTGKRRLA